MGVHITTVRVQFSYAVNDGIDIILHILSFRIVAVVVPLLFEQCYRAAFYIILR